MCLVHSAGMTFHGSSKCWIPRRQRWMLRTPEPARGPPHGGGFVPAARPQGSSSGGRTGGSPGLGGTFWAPTRPRRRSSGNANVGPCPPTRLARTHRVPVGGLRRPEQRHASGCLRMERGGQHAASPQQVVGHCPQGEPSGVGMEVSGWQVGQCTGLAVRDDLFHHRVAAVLAGATRQQAAMRVQGPDTLEPAVLCALLGPPVVPRTRPASHRAAGHPGRRCCARPRPCRPRCW
jgi:hypothetical protein